MATMASQPAPAAAAMDTEAAAAIATATHPAAAFTFSPNSVGASTANAAAASPASAGPAAAPAASAGATGASHTAPFTATNGPSSAPSGSAAASSSSSAAAAAAPSSRSSFFSFLRGELHMLDDDAPVCVSTPPPDGPSQLVYNFLILPWYLEKLLTLGFLICTDCFLHCFTVLPLRIVVTIVGVIRRMLSVCGIGGRSGSHRKDRPWFTPIQLCDLARGLLLLTCWFGLAFVNMSRMYHYIRGQSVLKLYVLFNILGISDRLFCSFGEDILESLFASIATWATTGSNAAAVLPAGGKPAPVSRGVRALHVLFHFVISVLYVFGHSLLLFAQVITLNVSVNSDNSSLFVVLVSNNFIELKGAVFKRFDHHNLMQISASDIVERFQLTVFLAVIIVQNLAHIGLAFAFSWGATNHDAAFPGGVGSGGGGNGGANGSSSNEWLLKVSWMCFMVLGGEWVVDWIKHGFISKFNDIPPIVYRHFAKVLCTDFIHTHRAKNEQSGMAASHSIHSVSRRLGLPSLPIAVLVVRVVYQAFMHSPSHLLVKASLLAIGFMCLALLKCLLTIVLLGHAAKRVIVEPLERERAEAFAAALQAPAHQHLRTKRSPSPMPVIVPSLVPRSPHMLHPPLHPQPATAGGTPLQTSPQQQQILRFAAAVAGPSSTAPSPSLTGVAAPKPSAVGSGGHVLSPLALQQPAGSSGSSVSSSKSNSNTPSRASTPRIIILNSDAQRSPREPVTATTIPLSGILLSAISAAASSSSEDADALAAAAEELDTVPEPALSVTVTDSDRGSREHERLTERFGRIHTPTALERANSSMSPQPPVTPSEVTSTVTLQLQTDSTSATIQQLYPAVADAASTSPAMDSGSARSEDDAAADDSSVTSERDDLSAAGSSSYQTPPQSSASGSSTASVHSSSLGLAAGVDSVEILHLPPGVVVSGSGGGVTEVHIFHHSTHAPHLPSPLVLTSPPGSAVEGTSSSGGGGGGGGDASASEGAAATPAAISMPTGEPSSASTSASSSQPQQQQQQPQPQPPQHYAPTVVTISSGVAKEKAPPAYEDAAKMEQDLLNVQRYKISANKAIPV